MTTIKKKLNRADYMFEKKTGEELMKKPGDVNGLDFNIRDLKDCTVYLLDHTAQVRYFSRLISFTNQSLDFLLMQFAYNSIEY
jgi:hypothetical protein